MKTKLCRWIDRWAFSADLTNLMSRKDRIFRVLTRWSLTLSLIGFLFVIKSFNLFEAEHTSWWLVISVTVLIGFSFILDVVNAVRPFFKEDIND